MEELHLGTVIDFKKQRGFGHIEPDDKSEFGGKVYCHWKTIKTSAKWPTLANGMRVAFLAKEAASKEASWKTTEVYDENGDDIVIGNPAQKTKNVKKSVKKTSKDVLLQKGKTFRGSCRSYDKSKGTGLVKPDGNGPWPKTGLKVLRSDVAGDGGNPALRKGLRLQFKVAKKGNSYRAVEVTLPGGRTIPTDGGNKKVAKKTAVKKPQKTVKKVQKVVVKKSQAKKKSQAVKNAPKKVVKNPKKKDNRKRQLSQVSKVQNPPTKKRNNSRVAPKKTTLKRSKIASGVYGGMEVDEEDVVEVGLLIRGHWIGGLIGKNGVVIKEIRKFSEANMKFGDEEIELDGGVFKVFAISGTMNQVADACKMVTEKLGEAAQTLEYKIVFLVPDAYCGMFIGKKGATINEIRGEMDLRVRVMLSQDPIMLPGTTSQVTLCTVYGPRDNMKDSIERTVAVLGAISTRLKKQMTEPNQWGGDGGWDGGYRGTTSQAGGWGGRSGGQGGRRGGRW